MANNELIQLPNKDLWRGHTRQPRPSDNVTLGDVPRPFAKIDEAVAQMLKLANGARELTCLWCGLQMESQPMREHLKKNHASVVEPPTDDRVAAALAAVEAAKTE